VNIGDIEATNLANGYSKKVSYQGYGMMLARCSRTSTLRPLANWISNIEIEPNDVLARWMSHKSKFKPVAFHMHNKVVHDVKGTFVIMCINRDTTVSEIMDCGYITCHVFTYARYSAGRTTAETRAVVPDYLIVGSDGCIRQCQNRPLRSGGDHPRNSVHTV
jgi:hypothetical protein